MVYYYTFRCVSDGGYGFSTLKSNILSWSVVREPKCCMLCALLDCVGGLPNVGPVAVLAGDFLEAYGYITDFLFWCAEHIVSLSLLSMMCMLVHVLYVWCVHTCMCKVCVCVFTQ